MTDTPPPPPPPDLTPPSDGWYNNPVPMEKIRPVRAVGLTAMITTAIVVLASAFITILTPGVADEAREFLSSPMAQEDEDQFISSYNTIGAAQFVQSIGTLIAAVTAMVWMFRMAKNVRAFGRSTSWAPIFGFVGWFLPPVLVIIPFLMLRELWKASAPFPAAGEDNWRSGPDLPVLWLWFALYGVVQTLLFVWQASTLVGAGLSNSAVDLAESIDEAGAISLVSGVTMFASGLAWMMVIRHLNERHTVLTNER